MMTQTNVSIASAVVWNQLDANQQRAILQRPAQQDNQRLMAQVKAIIEQVAEQGDQALLELTEKFDGVRLSSVLMDSSQVRAQAEKTAADVKRAIDQAYANIRAFHEAQQPQPVSMETMAGVLCEQRFAPLEKVGLYIPGGSASLPSTVLMCGVPAQLAGCSERILISPPDADTMLTPAICYAALKCEVTQVCLSGGAQAIAALALGTQSIPAVDKIVGPGNSYVTAAKQYVSQLPGGPAIDLPAGPSELLVIADDSADPMFVAADLLSQAEHGPDSQVILLSPSARLVEATRHELAKQLSVLPRAEITAQALQSSSLIVTADLTEAAAISQRYAPEHLSLQIENPTDWIDRTNKAGSIFVGHYAPESGGDYATGTNHVLPTYGYARSYSSLGLADFYRRYTVQQLTPQGLQDLAPTIMALAAEEQLDAHKNAVSLRLSSQRMADDLAAHSEVKSSVANSVANSVVKSSVAKDSVVNSVVKNTVVKNTAQRLLRKHLRTVTPYASARRSMTGGRIWLNANESPYTRDYQVNTDNLNRYPNFQSSDLNRAYANYAGVDAEQLLSHRGSDESIELLIRSFCEPGQDRVMICPPTYGMYAISASLNNTPVTAVPLIQDHDKQQRWHLDLEDHGAQKRWQLDIDAIRANSEGVKVVFLCHPANPLGNLLDPRDIETVLEHFAGKAVVVVDEAYIEYALQLNASASFAARINEFDNLVVMRTLSKAFGLAGIRVGFTLANRDIVQALVPVLAPYPLPDVSIQLATQALSADNLIEMRQNVIEAVSERERLTAVLHQLDYVQRVEPSSTNFILIQVTDADALMNHCIAAGILLRNQSAQVGLDNCIRITVGAPAENEQLMDVLHAFSSRA